jgi:hypothetical protein
VVTVVAARLGGDVGVGVGVGVTLLCLIVVEVAVVGVVEVEVVAQVVTGGVVVVAEEAAEILLPSSTPVKTTQAKFVGGKRED